MSQPQERPEERPGLVALATAAELIALAMRARLEQRLAWLERGAADWPEAEHAWAADRTSGEESTRRLAGPEGRAWVRLVALFGVTAAEADLLSLAVAVAVEPALGPLVARAQGSEGQGGTGKLPTEPLAKRLFGHPARPIWRPTGALARWGLASPVAGAPGVPPGFEADPRVVDWLFGAVALDAPLVLAVDKARHEPAPPEWPVQETAARLARTLRTGAPARLVVEGRAGSGRRLFGAAVARALGREAVVADPATLAADWPDRFMRLQRFALYADAAVIWAEGAPAWPAKIPLAPVQIVCVAEGAAAPALDGAADLRLVLPEPGAASKAAIWARLAPDLAACAARLAATPGVSLGDLEAASRLAPRTLEEASAHLRAMARARMQGVGRVVDPQVGWDDLIAAPALLAQLRRLAFEARARPALMEHAETARLFAGAAGLSALFSGPPGVGKSMAAQVIARELGVNLLVVDLASTTSKYVGETAKNLSAAFAHARAAGAALIFEEADAFFARRTDVKDSNDRHANADTSHLLQLMELHDGLVILSSNRRANIDPAFIRRLRHVVEFPRPGPAERRHLWAVMLAALGVAPAPLAATLDRLAETHDLSPAQIKGAALSARYTALAEERAMTAGDLEDGATRELAKEGRAAPARAGVTPRRRGSGGGPGHG
jgi:hypothetical protein